MTIWQRFTRRRGETRFGRRVLASAGITVAIAAGVTPVALTAVATSASATTSSSLKKEVGYPGGDDAVTGSFEGNDNVQPIPGQTLMYRLTLTRVGPTTGSTELVRDVLPTGLDFAPGSFEGLGTGESATYDPPTRTISWNVVAADTNDKDDTLTYRAVVTQAGAEPLTNSAAIVTPAGRALASTTVTPTPVVKNPDLPARCRPFQVTLVLDASGSIDSPGVAVDAVRAAALSFLRGLDGTGSKANVVQFSNLGQTLLAPMTEINATTLSSSAAGNELYDALYDSDGYYKVPGSGNWTNWAAGLNQAKTLYAANAASSPDLVLFVTDGVPNKYVLSGTQTDDDTEARRSISRNKAVEVANSMKVGPDGLLGTSDDIKLIGVGVGQIATSPGADSLWTRNLLAVTGDSFALLPSNPSNLATAAGQVTAATIGALDAVVFSDFASLGGVLGSIVSSLCENSLTINKVINTQPASGWTFNVTSFQFSGPGAATWLNSSGVSVGTIATPRSGTTGPDGSTSFRWQITGGNQSTTGATLTFNEALQPGYELVGVACNRGGTVIVPTTTASPISVRVPNGSNVTCTVENRPKSTIVVKKIAQPGGSESFGFKPVGFNGGNTISLVDTSGSGAQQSFDVSSGVYTLGEQLTGAQVTAGWYRSGLACDDPTSDSATTGSTATIKVNAGETVTCTWTNTKKGRIVIVEQATPASSDSFPFTSTIPGSSSFSLVPTTGSTSTSFTVDPGTYGVTQNTPPAWLLSSLDCDDSDSTQTTTNPAASIVVAPGETVTCTYVNTKKATITIVEDAVPNDQQDFAFTVPPTFQSTPLTLDDDSDSTLSSSKTFTVAPGTYPVDQGDTPGWVLTGLVCSNGSTVDLSTGVATITANAGDSITCTWKNEKRASITIVKRTDGVNGAFGPFEFKLTDTTNNVTQAVTISTNGTKTFSDLVPGRTYSLGESDFPGFAKATSVACTGGAPSSITLPGTFSLTAATALTCTATNVAKKGTVTVVKSTVGGTGTFTFTVSPSVGSTDVTTAATAPSSASKTFGGVNPGTYTVTESAASSWILGAVSCTSTDATGTAVGTQGSSVATVAPGGSVRCEVTNTKKAGLTVTKQVTGLAQGSTWAFTFNLSGGPNGGDRQVSSSASSTATWTDLAPGQEYTLTETAVAGYGTPTVSGTGCNATLPATFVFQPGTALTCRVTNPAQPATITLTKSVSGYDGPWSFDFTLNGGSTRTTTQSTGTVSWSGLLPGQSYVVAEVRNASYTSTLTCNDKPVSAQSPVVLTPGSTVDCTATNAAKKARITVTKKVDGIADFFGSFVFELTGPTGTSTAKATAVVPATFDNVVPSSGTYTLREIDIPMGYAPVSLVCGAIGGTDGVSLTVKPGDVVTCEAENRTLAADLTIAKTLTNAPGATWSFDVQVAGPVGSPDQSTRVVTLTNTNPSTKITGLRVKDQYTVSELPAEGFAPGTITCDSASAPATVGTTATIAVGGATCDITNTKVGSVTVTKELFPSLGSTDWRFTFQLTPGVAPSTKVVSFLDNPIAWETLPATTYTLKEVDLGPFYTPSNLYCFVGNAEVASALLTTTGVTLALNGQDVDCFATNNRTGIVRLNKDLVNATQGSTWSFDFVLSGANGYVSTATATESSSAVWLNVPQGDFTIKEVGVDTTTILPVGGTCDARPRSTGDFPNVEVEGLMSASDLTVDCSYINLIRGKITVVKQTVGGRPGTFSFDLAVGGQTVGSTTLAVTGVSSVSHTFDGLIPTFVYKLTELANVEPGWSLRDLSCVGAENVTIEGSRASIPPVSNGDVTCTFTNERVDLVVTKDDSEPAGGVKPTEPVTYTIRVTNASSVSAQSTAVVTDVLPDAFTWVSVPDCTIDGQTITCEIAAGDLEAGETVTITAVAKANADAVAGTYKNVVVVDTPDDPRCKSGDPTCTPADECTDAADCPPPACTEPGCERPVCTDSSTNTDCESTDVARVIHVNVVAACKADTPFADYSVIANFDPSDLPINLKWGATSTSNTYSSTLTSSGTFGSTENTKRAPWTPYDSAKTGDPAGIPDPTKGWFRASSFGDAGLSQLWPGTELVIAGDATSGAKDWPGWQLTASGWEYSNTGANPFEGGDLRGGDAFIVFSVNPTATFGGLSYPPATPNCNSNPPADVTVTKATRGGEPAQDFDFTVANTEASSPSTTVTVDAVLATGTSTTVSVRESTKDGLDISEDLNRLPGIWRSAGHACSVDYPKVNGTDPASLVVNGDDESVSLTALAGSSIDCTFLNETFDLSVDKTSSASSVAAGATFDWNVKVTNLGTGDARSTATVTDWVPAPLQVTTLPAVCPSTSPWYGGTLITCELPAVALTAGASTTITYTTSVPADTPAGEYTNVVVVQTPGDCGSTAECPPPPSCEQNAGRDVVYLDADGCVPPPNECLEQSDRAAQRVSDGRIEGDFSNNVACDTVTVTPTPKLTIDKKLSRSEDFSRPTKDFFQAFGYSVGSTAVYQYKVTNTGNIGVSDLVLGDELVFGISPQQPSAPRIGVPTVNSLTACRIDNDLSDINVSTRAVVDPFTFGSTVPVTLQPGEAAYLYCLLPISAQLRPLPVGNPNEGIFNRASVTGTPAKSDTKLPVVWSAQTKISFVDPGKPSVIKNLVTIQSDGTFDFSSTTSVAWGSTAVFRMVVNNSVDVPLSVRVYDYFSQSNLDNKSHQNALFDQMKCIDHDDVALLPGAFNRTEFYNDDAVQGVGTTANSTDRTFSNGTFYARERVLDANPATRGDGVVISAGDTDIDPLVPGDGYAILCYVKLPSIPKPVTSPDGLLQLTNTFRVLADRIEELDIPDTAPGFAGRLFLGAPLFQLVSGPNPVAPADYDLQASAGVNTAPTCEQLGNCPPPPCTVNCFPPPCTDCIPRTVSADVQIVKDASVTTITPGSTFSYTLTVRNAGPDDAVEVRVQDRVPATLTLLTATSTGASCTATASTATCTRPLLTVNSTFSIRLNVQANAGLTNGTTIKNTATATSTTPDPNLSNNTDDADIKIVVQQPVPPIVQPLPPTGSDPWQLARYAFVMVGVGGLVLLVTRRTRAAGRI